MSATQEISALTAWAERLNASLHPSVEVVEDPHTGLSFRVRPSASGPVQPHEPVVTIPAARLSLSYLNALSDDGPDRFHDGVLAGLAPHVLGRIFLVKEYAKGLNASFWAPYIQALPQPDDRPNWALPPFWDADDVELLDGTNLEVGIQNIKANVKQELGDIQRLLALHQPESAFAQIFTPALYHWAYCIFSSRSFRPSLVLSESEQQQQLPEGVKVDDFSMLLPLFDIGNHDMTSPVQWDRSGPNGNFSLKVGKAFGPGEQIYNNYSMKTNAELLLGYGFMLPVTDHLHNDYIHVRKRTSAPGPSEEFFISLRPMTHPSSVLGLSKQPPGLTESTPVLRAFQHVQPALVWDIFCAIAPPDQRAQLIPIADGSLQGDAADSLRQALFLSGQLSPDGRPYLEQTVAIVQHKVFRELERLNETDVEVAGAGELDKNQKLALEYRERCRQVLESTLEAIDSDDFFEQE
ncbi:Ribosomal lysine N-methyltransferase set10 [Paramyrothecium foliicola]|nr:Ribosomal lysine N-methyltransferase set10 [Paramyrothecium foliicola]